MSYPRALPGRTRSGIGPVPAPVAAEAFDLDVMYYVPTPAWMRVDYPDAPPMTETDYVGYHRYLARERHRL